MLDIEFKFIVRIQNGDYDDPRHVMCTIKESRIEEELKQSLHVTFCRMNAKRSYFKQNKKCYCDNPVDFFLCDKQPIKSVNIMKRVLKWSLLSKMQIAIIPTLLIVFHSSKFDFITVKFKKKWNQNGDDGNRRDVFCTIK